MSSELKQNLIVLIDRSEGAWDISINAGTMTLNRFCIDERDDFDLHGIYYFKHLNHYYSNDMNSFEEKQKGKGYS